MTLENIRTETGGSKECSRTVDVTTGRRMATAYYYYHVDNAPAPETWDGKDGYISKLRTLLAFPKGSSARLKKTWKALLNATTQEKFTTLILQMVSSLVIVMLILLMGATMILFILTQRLCGSEM